VIDLEAEIDMLDSQLKSLLARAAPPPASLLAVSTDHAGTLLAAAGQNVDRLSRSRGRRAGGISGVRRGVRGRVRA
jgi:hypothetical protein